MAHINDKHGNPIDPTLLAPATRMILHCAGLAGKEYRWGGIVYYPVCLIKKGDVHEESLTHNYKHSIQVLVGGIKVKRVFRDGSPDEEYEVYSGEVPLFAKAGHDHVFTALHRFTFFTINHAESVE